jgi:hypothetical protein
VGQEQFTDALQGETNHPSACIAMRGQASGDHLIKCDGTITTDPEHSISISQV